jgi:hypothetical protein
MLRLILEGRVTRERRHPAISVSVGSA